jgi:hypothetical protein
MSHLVSSSPIRRSAPSGQIDAPVAGTPVKSGLFGSGFRRLVKCHSVLFPNGRPADDELTRRPASSLIRGRESA